MDSVSVKFRRKLNFKRRILRQGVFSNRDISRHAPKVVTFDFTNCDHLCRYRNGHTPQGKQMWKCRVCGTQWYAGMTRRQERFAQRILAAFRRGDSARAASRNIPCAPQTAERYYRRTSRKAH
jgi:hypothetical protein